MACRWCMKQSWHSIVNLNRRDAMRLNLTNKTLYLRYNVRMVDNIIVNGRMVDGTKISTQNKR